MRDDLFIDEQGRFQMASADLAAFVEFLRANEVPCTVQEPHVFTAEGRSYGYGRLHHRYDVEVALDLHGQWRNAQDECRAGRTQSR